MMNESMLEKIIGAALRRVEEGRGLGALTLRAVARDAVCSHVNLYNYVDSLDSLVWLVYGRALGLFREACFARVEARSGAETILGAYASGMMAFAAGHEGLYRVLWFEKLEGEPPAQARALIEAASKDFAALGAQGLSELGCSSSLAAKAQIYFSFLHGRIAIQLNGRIIGTWESEKAITLRMAKRLAESLAR